MAQAEAPGFKAEGIVSENTDSFHDKKIDYSYFIGRVTDRDHQGNIYKIRVENNNTKFLRVGDLVQFSAKREQEDFPCEGYVRDTENNYFVIYVKNLSLCFPEATLAATQPRGEWSFLKIGTKLKFYSVRLAERVLAGSSYRKILLDKREDFLRQLNRINNFLFHFNEERVQVGLKFDRRVEEIRKEKLLAMERILEKQRESVILKKELVVELDKLDKDLTQYQVERVELFTDRFQMDKDTGLPMGVRPPPKREVAPMQYLNLNDKD